MDRSGQIWEKVEEKQPSLAPPKGFYPAHVDDKGRLKLPVRFREYLASLGDKTFFVTTLGRGIARVYPNSRWDENLDLFSKFTNDPEAARRLAFTANAFGGESEMDGQGRLLLPPELRRKLGLENQSVQLLCFRGRVDIYSQVLYDRELAASEQSAEQDLDVLEKHGLV